MATSQIQISPEEPGDEVVVRKIVEEAFGQTDEADLVDRLRASEGFDARLSVIARVGGEAVGHVLFTPVAVTDNGSATTVLSLAPLAVRPAFQRQGIGQQLTRRGFEIARSLGYTVVIVVGHPSYYPRLGFVPALPLGIRDPVAHRPEASMVVELVPGALDGVRGEVVYPPAFTEPEA